MRKRRFFVSLIVIGVVLGLSAGPASAATIGKVPVPPAPNLRTTVKSMVPPPPTVIVPSVPDPNNLMLPFLPAVNPPPGLRPALGVLSPTTVVTCQASYLGPLAVIVAMSKVMDTAGQHPVQPSFFTPLFSPVLTLCASAPFPTVHSCGPDASITAALANHPDLPAVPGGVPTVDPFADVPAPFASAVVELGALQYDVEHYVYGDTFHLNVQDKAEKQLECK